MKFSRVFLSVAIIFILFSGSHPPANPGNPIEEWVVKILEKALNCFDDEEPHNLEKELVGEWQMTLLRVNPPLPDIPFSPIKKNSTWRISSNFAIRYDGNTKWYNEPPGVNFTVTPPSVSPNAKKTACTYRGGGSAFKDAYGIPLVAWYTNITAKYTDSITITMESDNSVTATIQVNVSGNFTEDGKVKQINASETIIYTGVRK